MTLDLVQNADLLKEDVSRPFSSERFNMRRLPVLVGRVPIESIGNHPSSLDMLIKLPGGPLCLPEPYASCDGVGRFLVACLAREDALLPGWRKTHHLYLTFDRREVQPGGTHRNEGWHFDGMQGARYPDKLNACHQYVLSTHLPTEYASHPVDASGLDDLRHDWFRELGSQIPEATPVFRPAPGEICLMSAYQMHRSPLAGPQDGGWRTFIRLDVSLKEQDRAGNTLNPDLPAPWEFVPRSLPEGLQTPVRDAGWERGEKFV
ncbi:MAG: hypothetical protein ABJN42_09790 [Roseibium sp.]|uniref:hypothetical protein n=1 Tax=Roseibium sp. TaxID=1936156 RepID=UPI00329A4E0B